MIFYFRSLAFILLVLYLGLGKEIISYDEEKLVGYAIIGIGYIIYLTNRHSLVEKYDARSNKIYLRMHYMLDFKLSVMRWLRRYWRIFLDTDDNSTKARFYIEIVLVAIHTHHIWNRLDHTNVLARFYIDFLNQINKELTEDICKLASVEI